MFDRSVLRDLGPAEAIDAAVTARRTANRAEADLLAIAVHYVDVCPVLDGENPAGWADRRPDRTPDRAPDRSLDAAPDPLAGDGTPDVAEFAVEELAPPSTSATTPPCSWSPTPSSCATASRTPGRW
jgi:hypothetical protein